MCWCENSVTSSSVCSFMSTLRRVLPPLEERVTKTHTHTQKSNVAGSTDRCRRRLPVRVARCVAADHQPLARVHVANRAHELCKAFPHSVREHHLLKCRRKSWVCFWPLRCQRPRPCCASSCRRRTRTRTDSTGSLPFVTSPLFVTTLFFVCSVSQYSNKDALVMGQYKISGIRSSGSSVSVTV